MELVFATSNKNKIKEIAHLIGGKINLLGLSDIGCMEEVPETEPTIEGNALQKAIYVYENYSRNCFADDTGLEVYAIENRPGVYSARYAGETKNPHDNMDKLLKEMEHIEDRRARFRTVIALVIDGREWLFEGIAEGSITRAKRGREGFGYDPVFQPAGYDMTFAEMDLELKSKISHRGIAVRKLVDHLNKLAV